MVSKRRKVSITYKCWQAMKQRCLNHNCPDYKDYGAKGITICDSWLSFGNFVNDLGERPSTKYTVDRIDGTGNYEPSNVRWATRYEQAQNTKRTRLITFNGKCQGLNAWAREIGIDHRALTHRLNIGLSIAIALTTPKQQGRKIKESNR